ncbi:MAG: heavy metal-associated domain-containing protein [Bacilli bacterium]
MKKTLYIEGMSCAHCSARVEKALNKIDGVKAKVDLSNNLANLTLKNEIDDKVLIDAVEDAGYSVSSVK